MAIDSQTKSPSLPLPGQTFAPRYDRPGSSPLGENIVIASFWNTEDPDGEGCYTAYLLTLDEGTILDDPQYVVFDIACDVNDDRWVVDEEKAFGSIKGATEHYCRLSGDD